MLLNLIKNYFRKFYWCFETPQETKCVIQRLSVKKDGQIQIEKIKQSGGSD